MLQPNIFGTNNKFYKGANIFVFTPRKHNTTILRPQVFNFTHGMADEFMSSYNQEHINNSFRVNSDLMGAILPSRDGIQLDTYNFDNYWSFILVMDGDQMVTTDSRYGAPMGRTILTGYFLDEPFVPHTLNWVEPIQNENAKIMFTQESRLTLQHYHGMQSGTSIRVSANNDLIQPCVGVMGTNANGDMMLTDTGSIARNVSHGSEGNSRFVSNSPVVIGQMQKAKSSARDLYSPRHQLQGLAKCITGGLVEAEAEAAKYSAYGQGIAQHIPSYFSNYANNEVGMVNGTIPSIGNGGIDPSIPATFKDLDDMFGGELRVKPIEVPSVSQWDVYGQEYIDERSTMSNLVVSVVNGLATEYKLASISFRYSTWSPEHLSRNNVGGIWSIIDATPLIKLPDEQYRNDVQRFKSDLEISLFPTLKSIGGDFDLMVHFNMTHSTLVDLVYQDSRKDYGGSFYEHHNRLGGLTAPNIGDTNTFNHNTDQYSSLLGDIAANINGPTTFGNGIDMIPNPATVETVMEQPYTR